MKAHRRKGIPTLMLQTGGSPKVMLGPRLGGPLGRRLLSESQEERRGLASGLTQALEDRDNLLQRNFRFGPQDQPDTETQLARDIRTVGKIIDPATVIPRGIMGLVRGYNKYIGEPFAKRARTEVPTPAGIEKAAQQSAQAEAEAQANAQADLARTQAQRAADALSGGVRRPPTTPADKAKAAQADQAAETAKASQAAASVSSPEEEAFRQATGAPSSAEEAAAAAKSGDLSQGPSLVQGKDGTTIASIMGGPAAVFNEKERLNELKTTFGLNLSDMEKAAPGIAFSLSLMGAQRAPGESVFNALARSAGSAGEGALKAKLALDAKERAIDSSLVSTVLGEKKVADAYAKNKTWAVVWDGGFDKNGNAGASFYRMNARQLDEAAEAGLPVVPMDFLKSSMTTQAAKAAYRSKAGTKAQELFDKRVTDYFGSADIDIPSAVDPNNPTKGIKYRGINPSTGKIEEVSVVAELRGQASMLDGLLRDSARSIGLATELENLATDVPGATNVIGAGFGQIKSFLGLSGDSVTTGQVMAEARKRGAIAFKDLNSVGKGVDADKAFNTLGAEKIREMFSSVSGINDKSDDQLRELLRQRTNSVSGYKPLEELKDNATVDERNAYEKRVRFRTVQNTLAAQLAPVLLGESGRTISDADRVRVIALLGGFADFSKAGIFSTVEQVQQSTKELKDILRGYQTKALSDTGNFLGSYDAARALRDVEGSALTNTFVPALKPGEDIMKTVERLRGYYKTFEDPNNPTPVQSSTNPQSATGFLDS